MLLTRHAGSHRTAALAGLLSVALLVAPRLVAAAAPAVSEDVPVPGGTAALAKALEIDPVPDRARFAAEVARIIYDDTKERRTYVDSKFRQLSAYLETIDRHESASTRGNTVRADSQFERVPVPLPSVVWSEVLRRPVDPAHLFAIVMSDAAAAFLVHGLAALDDETLQFFVDHPAAVRQLYERGAPAFATFAAHLQVRANRVVVPGGDQAVPLWEALVGEKTGQPARFILHLFTRDKGRLAYLYDTIGSLDPARASFALGLWIADARARVDRFRALGSAVTAMGHNAWADRSPFRRAPHDLVSMLLRAQPQPTGAPAAPAWRVLWARAFDSSDASGDLATLRATPAHGESIDAAWLVETLLQGDAALAVGASRSVCLWPACAGVDRPGGLVRCAFRVAVPSPLSHVDAHTRTHRRPSAGALRGSDASRGADIRSGDHACTRRACQLPGRDRAR